MTGTVFSIERCSLHDGPGLRTTVFLKGCPLKCRWCHNPESLSFEPELYFFAEKCTSCGICVASCPSVMKLENTYSTRLDLGSPENCTVCGKCASSCPNSAIEIKGQIKTAQDVIAEVLKDARYYKSSGGGMTISGGEPLAQLDFTLELLRLAKENNIHTCIETSGHGAKAKLLAIVPYVDLFLFDFKESDDTNHKKFTGVSRELIAQNLQALNDADAKIILRCPIIPTCNERAEHFSAIAKVANELRNIIEVNIMPYHPMGAPKAARIGREYEMPEIPFPTDEQIDEWVNAVARETEKMVRLG